jgi:hypothetical protein
MVSSLLNPASLATMGIPYLDWVLPAFVGEKGTSATFRWR